MHALRLSKKKKTSLYYYQIFPPPYTFLSQFLYKLLSLGRTHFHFLTVSLLVSNPEKHILCGDELHKVPGKCKWKGNGCVCWFIANFSSSSQVCTVRFEGCTEGQLEFKSHQVTPNRKESTL